MNRRMALRALLAVPLCAMVMPAQAQGFDLAHGGPVAITAKGGFALDQAAQTATAFGDARAVRGDVTVLADKLVAHYRKKNSTRQAPVRTTASEGEGGDNEVYRLEAIGHVRIFTPTDTATGDRAVYDMDQAVLVLTGHDLRITTPTSVITARDSLEYWTDKHMAVARGNAVATANDGRQVRADVLVAYTKPAPAPGTATAKAGTSAEAQAGSLEKVEAFGHVEIRNATVVAQGERGVYLPATGKARLVGHVRITRGENEIEGPAADVDLHTGQAQLVADPNAPVSGLLMPQSAPGKTGKP